MSTATPSPQSKNLPAQPNQNRQLSAVEVKENRIAKFIASNSKKLMSSLAGSGFTWESFARLALTCLRKTPQLLDCTPESILASIIEAAHARLRIDGITGQAYLVPFKSEAVLVPGYKGLIELARRSNEIKSVSCDVVCQGDEFDYQLGDEPFVHHKPQAVSETITHAYVCFTFKSGGKFVNVWPFAKIMAHGRKYSPAFNKSDSVWQRNPRVACMKTVIRDSINRGMVPVSVEAQKLAMREELVEHMQSKERESGKVDDIESLTEFLLSGTDTGAEVQSLPEPTAEGSTPLGAANHIAAPTKWRECPGLLPDLLVRYESAIDVESCDRILRDSLTNLPGELEQAASQTARDGRVAEILRSQAKSEEAKEAKGKGRKQGSLVE